MDRNAKRKIDSAVAHNFKLSVILFVTVFVQVNLFFVHGGSIVSASCYPEERKIYEFVDHFTSQAMAVNTNTTVLVGIDGESPILMTDYGLRHEIASGDNAARDWFTWEIVVPAMTKPGNHTFQFFNHYYVWQQADQNWAEYSSYSNVKSFIISDSNPTSSITPSENSPSTNLQVAIISVLILCVIATIALIVWRIKDSSKKHNLILKRSLNRT